MNKNKTLLEEKETYFIAFLDYEGKCTGYYAPFPMGFGTSRREEAVKFESFAELQKALAWIRSERFFNEYGRTVKAIGLTNESGN